MKITKISRAVRRPEHVNIYLADKYWLNIHQDVLLDLGLYQGMEISLEQKKDIAYQARQKRTLERVYNYLVRRPHSKLETKLFLIQRCQLNVSDAQKLLNKLIKEGKLSNKKFTSWYIQQRLEFGVHGINKIRAELIQKGVSQKIIKEKLNQENPLLDPHLVSKKIKAYLQKIKPLIKFENRYQLKQKLMQRLLSRGFTYEEIKEAGLFS